MALLSAAAVFFFHRNGWLLYYGDAEAHLNIARRIVDSRTPGYEQLGIPWLPLLHLLMLPFVRLDSLWQSGIAGAIPSAVCFVIAGSFLFAAVRRVFESLASAACATALFALNPNILYLQSIPMTESMFFASLLALLYFTVRFRDTQGWGSVACAGIAACAGTLTRYEGWFLIPFVAAYFFLTAERRRIGVVLTFCALAAIGPVCWIAYNWWMTGDFLEFYRGASSARAIQGGKWYPGKDSWSVSWLYFCTAVQLCAGPGLALLAIAGLLAALIKRVFWPLFLLALPGLFYIWNMHSSGATPIFVPTLWPHSYYNSRYGTAALPLLAMVSAALVAVAPTRMRAWLAALLVAVGTAWWVAHPSPGAWVTWEESRVNSEGRRAWTRQAAEYLAPRFVPGSGIITSFNDLTGIFREMGVPLRETFTGDNGLAWQAALNRPELLLTQEWAVAMGGDPLETTLNRAGRYTLVKVIILKDAPVIEIYRR